MPLRVIRCSARDQLLRRLSGIRLGSPLRGFSGSGERLGSRLCLLVSSILGLFWLGAGWLGLSAGVGSRDGATLYERLDAVDLHLSFQTVPNFGQVRLQRLVVSAHTTRKSSQSPWADWPHTSSTPNSSLDW